MGARPLLLLPPRVAAAVAAAAAAAELDDFAARRGLTRKEGWEGGREGGRVE